MTLYHSSFCNKLLLTKHNSSKSWFIFNYSFHLNTSQLKSEHSTFRILCLVSNGLITWLGGTFEYWTFWSIKQSFFVHLSNHHSKNKPFNNQASLNHLNTRLVRYSDGYCIYYLSKVFTVHFYSENLDNFA